PCGSPSPRWASGASRSFSGSSTEPRSTPLRLYRADQGTSILDVNVRPGVLTAVGRTFTLPFRPRQPRAFDARRGCTSIEGDVMVRPSRWVVWWVASVRGAVTILAVAVAGKK